LTSPGSPGCSLGTVPLGGAFLRRLVVLGDGTAGGGAEETSRAKLPWDFHGFHIYNYTYVYNIVEYTIYIYILLYNGNFRILKWRYVSTIFLAIFCGDIP